MNNNIIYTFIAFCFFTMAVLGFTAYRVTQPDIKYVDNGSVRTEVYVVDATQSKKLPYCALTDEKSSGLCWNQSAWNNHDGVSIISLDDSK